ncbi:OsmC family protein [Thiomicrorhabdus sp. ZW0627]|uniref:OsmC family protein n=1 Tax=Thiomicrorhabdus sp. ZW0627 TaxID=3039774 RepID=UPI002437114B|nr:OsmC family protein [Thiomicrorhabdus sp. ZW0627]MDG6773740.1 OsmC family protein [Thiomicrorhabdus sp. ZW0627]
MAEVYIPSCIRPIDNDGLNKLAEAGKANPNTIKTLKSKTVLEGQFKNLNYVRDLDPVVVDEPPVLLGEDTAPNPSEMALLSLGSCLSVGVQANATARGINLTKLEIELEGDINITAVWGTGDIDPNKKLGVTEVRAFFTIEAPGTSKEELEGLVAHAIKWSPVANTYMNAVDLSGKLVD